MLNINGNISLIEAILISLLAFFLCIFLITIILRIYRMKSLRHFVDKKQKAEFISSKLFITQDQIEIQCLGKLKKDSEYIILGIHEIGMNKENFLEFSKYINSKKEFSFITFDQINYGKSKSEIKNSGMDSLIFNLNDMINNLKEKYPLQKIILLAEGNNYETIIYSALNNLNIYKIIGISPITKKGYKNSVANKFSYLTSWIISINNRINTIGKGSDLTNDKLYSKQIDDKLSKDGFITAKKYSQLKLLKFKRNKMLKKLNIKQLIIQPKNSIYLDNKKFNKLVNNTISKKTKIKFLDNTKHLFLNNKETNDKFDLILEWVNNHE